jgi:Helix-turn-helix domain
MYDHLAAEDVVFRDPDALLPERVAATLLGVTPRALQAWRQRGEGPVFCRISSRCVRYRRKDLIAFAESRLRTRTSDTSGEQEAAE